MSNNEIRRLCLAEEGGKVVLQGNIAFAVGCVRSGIHSADGYPGTPSTEVIDRGLSQVQDMIKVGWSVNEAVATGVAFGHTLAGEDAVVTMKIPGLFQSADVFTSSSFFYEKRGALIYFIASDFTPSSTQHVIDPRYLFKSCMVPVFEPRNHQEMMEASQLAADIGRQHKTSFVIFASGTLCHSEGLVRLNKKGKRDVLDVPADLRKFNLLPSVARVNYDTVMGERMPALERIVEESSLNQWVRGAGRRGVITYGINSAYVKEVRGIYGEELDILSLAFTNPLPVNLIREFCSSVEGEIYVFEDGYRYLQDSIEALGIKVIGKEKYSRITEWSPALIAERMGHGIQQKRLKLEPVPRPPMICAGCPYRLFALEVGKLRKRKKIEAIFGDIGCNSLLYFMGALDTGLAMGASDSKRQGFVLSRPEMVARCISIIGDSTECHTGLDSTRNAVFRNVPGIKVVLDNYWTAMTGGQPAPSSPVNLAGEEVRFDLVKALQSNGSRVMEVNAYERGDIRKALRNALSLAEKGEFVVVVVRGSCINKVSGNKKRVRLRINEEKCDRCHVCLICQGVEEGEQGIPRFNNLCSGCAGEHPACMQMCPFDAMEFATEDDMISSRGTEFPEPPELIEVPVDRDALPERLTLAIRGVGGQGNLFFGRVLTQLAFLAGYGDKGIVKGETHGMAQMGGPVISTFSCGNVHSPVLFPGSADCLITMEMSEILRPGFLELLKEGGVVLISKTSIVPQIIAPDQYPAPGKIKEALSGYEVIEVDALGRAIALGDKTGRIANVVMMGGLSKIAPFDVFPPDLWLEAIRKVSPSPPIWAANYAAFKAGRELV